jgi:hypothetical protein
MPSKGATGSYKKSCSRSLISAITLRPKKSSWTSSLAQSLSLTQFLGSRIGSTPNRGTGVRTRDEQKVQVNRPASGADDGIRTRDPHLGKGTAVVHLRSPEFIPSGQGVSSLLAATSERQ